VVELVALLALALCRQFKFTVQRGKGGVLCWKWVRVLRLRSSIPIRVPHSTLTLHLQMQMQQDGNNEQ
jgi:hypothetical protein